MMGQDKLLGGHQVVVRSFYNLQLKFENWILPPGDMTRHKTHKNDLVWCD